MTTSRQDLKSYFRDGEVPSGANFSSLIDSMVHVDQFESWRKTGEIDLANGQWRIYVDSANRLVADPDNPTKDRPTLALWHEGGWAGMPGRVGTYDHERETALAKDRPGLQVPLSVQADGKWRPIIGDLEGCHAFELVARVASPKDSGPQGITHAVALASASGAEISVHQAPAHRTLQRNVVAMVLLVLFVGLIMGLPEKYVEKGRAANEAVQKATALVEQRRERVEGLMRPLASDIIDIYPKPKFATKDHFTIDHQTGRREVKPGEVRAIENTNSERLQTKIFFGTGEGEASKIIPGNDDDVVANQKIADANAITAVEAVVASAYQSRINVAEVELTQARKALEEAEKAPILPRFVERFVRIAKPVGIAGILIIALNILVSHIRHRAAVRVRWRKRRNKLFGGDTKYDLCLRTGRDYGVDAEGVPVKIHYHVTRLWG